MITINHLTKIYKTRVKEESFITDLFARKYEEKVAVNAISFDIGENELVGFIGPNGAGKTTTMKILAGILYPTSGEVSVFGYTPFEKNHAFLKQIAFVMGQKNQLLWELPASDSFQLFKEVYEIEENLYRQTLADLLDLLDAHKLISQPIKTLSLGQRMRVELIATLLHTPKILFLDEPTIGLDIFAQTTIRNFIKEYQEKYKATIMLTSHYMQDVQKLARRVLLINHGNIIYDGSLSNLLTHYSDEKIIRFTLSDEGFTQSKAEGFTLEKSPINKYLRHYTYEYTYPILKIRLKKKNLGETLPKLIRNIEFIDMSVEDEPIEEVIKNIFTKSA